MQVPPFKATLMEAMPYIDFLFGNETEAAAFAATESWPEKELSAIALRIAAFPKASGRRCGPSHAPSSKSLLDLLRLVLWQGCMASIQLHCTTAWRSGLAAHEHSAGFRSPAHKLSVSAVISFQQPSSSLQSWLLPDPQGCDLS